MLPYPLGATFRDFSTTTTDFAGRYEPVVEPSYRLYAWCSFPCGCLQYLLSSEDQFSVWSLAFFHASQRKEQSVCLQPCMLEVADNPFRRNRSSIAPCMHGQVHGSSGKRRPSRQYAFLDRGIYRV